MRALSLFLVSSFFTLSCENETHLRLIPDQDGVTDAEQEIADDAAVTAPDVDTAAPTDEDALIPPDEDTAGTLCELDKECENNGICVQGSCVTGCTKDGDCAAYPGTSCNTETHRCLNETANDGACNDTRCPTGCCYAVRGFREVKCLIPPSAEYCGACPQGQVYMGRAECVPAACSTGDALCQGYNEYDVRSACFECKTGDLICYDNPACN